LLNKTIKTATRCPIFQPLAQTLAKIKWKTDRPKGRCESENEKYY
jgi:hypothetical protein